MTKKIILPSLLGIMLVAGQVAAQTVDTDTLFNFSGSIDAAVVIDTGTNQIHWSGLPIPITGEGYTIGFDVNNDTARVLVVGINTDDAAGSYVLGDTHTITADASNSLIGFSYQGTGTFTGELGFRDAGMLTVHNTGTGDALGAVFRDTSGNARVFNGTAKLGGITVITEEGDAFGWYSGAVSTGKLNLGTIHVTADGDATGIYIGGNLHDDDNLNKRSVLGNITAISSTGDAYGLFVTGEVENVFLKGDIEAIGAGVNTSGIRTGGDTTITLFSNRDFTIKTTYTGDPGSYEGADIWTSGDLTIDLGGSTLKAGRVFMEGGGEFMIDGTGRAYFDVVHNRDGTFILGGNGVNGYLRPIVSVDGGKMVDEGASLGRVDFSPTGRLQIYGDTEEFFTAIGTMGEGDSRQVLNMSTFTNWGVDEMKNITALGSRNKVFANDNYLAAAMIHHKRTGWHAMRDHLISGAVRAQPRYGYYGQAQQQVRPATRGAWVNYVGRSSYYESSFNGNKWDFATDGVQLGTDLWQVRKHQLGVFFGHEKSKGSNLIGGNLQDRLTAKDHYIGLYGVTIYQGGTDLRTVFTYGWQDYTADRNAANGELYQTAFKGNTAELNVELGRRYYFPDRYGIVSLRPAVGLDWYYNQLGGGVEVPMYDPEATSQAIRYGKADISQFFLRFGADFRYEKRRGAVEAGLHYSYDLRGSDLWASASSVETPRLQSTLVSSQQGRSVFTFNLGGSYWLCSNLTVFGGYRGEAVLDKAGRGYEHIGHVGGAWRW